MSAVPLLRNLMTTIDQRGWDDLADGLISRMTEVWTDVDQQPPAAARPATSG